MLVGMATKTIGERIRAAREAKGLSQVDLARLLKIKAPSLSQLESGKSGSPAAETLLRFRDSGFNPDYIMRGRGGMFLEGIERDIQDQEVLALLGELDDADRRIVRDLARSLHRKKAKPDPFGFDPSTQ